jgi:hypothetical protein
MFAADQALPLPRVTGRPLAPGRALRLRRTIRRTQSASCSCWRRAASVALSCSSSLSRVLLLRRVTACKGMSASCAKRTSATSGWAWRPGCGPYGPGRRVVAPTAGHSRCQLPSLCARRSPVAATVRPAAHRAASGGSTPRRGLVPSPNPGGSTITSSSSCSSGWPVSSSATQCGHGDELVRQLKPGAPAAGQRIVGAGRGRPRDRRA